MVEMGECPVSKKKQKTNKQTKKHALADIWLFFLLKLIVTNSSF